MHEHIVNVLPASSWQEVADRVSSSLGRLVAVSEVMQEVSAIRAEYDYLVEKVQALLEPETNPTNEE